MAGGAQFGALAKGLRDLPGAIAGGNFDYADKLFQWMLLPRAVLIAGILFSGYCLRRPIPFGASNGGILLWLLRLAVAMAIPDSPCGQATERGAAEGAWLGRRDGAEPLPVAGGVNKRFIHTEHGDESVVN